MSIDNVNVGQIEASERLVQAFDDVFTGEAAVVEGIFGVFGVVLAKVELYLLVLDQVRSFLETIYLGRNDQIPLLPTKVLDRFPHDNLRLSSGIPLGGIEEVDASIVGGFHTRKGFFCNHQFHNLSIDRHQHTIFNVSAIGKPSS